MDLGRLLLGSIVAGIGYRSAKWGALVMQARLTLAATALAVGLGATPVLAEQQSLYLGIGGGADWLHDIEAEAGPDRINNDIGWAGVGTVGYRFSNGLRAEIEGAGHFNDGETRVAGLDTDIRAWSAMGNLLYDFNLGSVIRPYVGVGVGTANVDVEIASVGSDAEWAFAYQAILGVGYPITDRFEAFIDYRYMATAGLDLGSGGPLMNEDEYRRHTVLAGVRLSLWQP